jgi:hypothetical protein
MRVASFCGLCLSLLLSPAFPSSSSEVRGLVQLFKKNPQEFRVQAIKYLEEKNYALPESRELLRLFSCGLFSTACDAQFTEKLCRELERQNGLLESDLLFLRATNLESLDIPASYELYTRIFEQSSYSPFKEEVLKKLWLLASYLNKQEEFLRWSRQKHVRLSLYIDPKILESPPFKRTLGLSHVPYRSFIGNPVVFTARAPGPLVSSKIEDDFFQWHFTSTEVYSQLPSLENAFYQEGFHYLYVDTISLQREHSCFMDMVPVYYFSILPRNQSRFPARSWVDFSLILVPYFSTSLYTVKWYVRPEDQVLEGPKTRAYFERSGKYQVTIAVSFGLYTLQREIEFYVD